MEAMILASNNLAVPLLIMVKPLLSQI